MKYSNEIIIHRPLTRVIELFDNPENLKQWQPGLESVELVSGVPGQPGAKSRLVYQMGKRTIEMVETVTVRNIPEEFSGSYETKGVFNTVTNRFIELDSHTTKMITESEFTFSSIPMRFFGWLMPGAFKKQSQKYLELFKAYAESEIAFLDEEE